MLITTWDSAAGALSYTVEAQGNTGETYNCTSSSNSCAVTGVPCGEHLSVFIVASNDNCSTNRVLGEVAETGTCWELCKTLYMILSIDWSWTRTFLLSLQFPVPPPMSPCQSSVAKILHELTGRRVSVPYSTLLLLRTQMETRTAVTQWAPIACCKDCSVDRITPPTQSAPIWSATAAPATWSPLRQVV